MSHTTIGHIWAAFGRKPASSVCEFANPSTRGLPIFHVGHAKQILNCQDRILQCSMKFGDDKILCTVPMVVTVVDDVRFDECAPSQVWESGPYLPRRSPRSAVLRPRLIDVDYFCGKFNCR
jgi:hypothetical protein